MMWPFNVIGALRREVAYRVADAEKKERSIVALTADLYAERERLTTAASVIEKVLKRGIKWYDHEQLDHGAKVNYYNNARGILQNETMRNEVNSFISDLVEEMVTKAKDYPTVECLRYSINGVQALVERLESIPDPTRPAATPVDTDL